MIYIHVFCKIMSFLFLARVSVSSRLFILYIIPRYFVDFALCFLTQYGHGNIFLNLLMDSTISQTSRPLIFLPFTQPFLTRNLKVDSQLLF